MRRLSPRLCAAVVALAWLVASCAPQRGPAPVVDALAARYGAMRDTRAAVLHAYTAELVVRADGRMVGKVPAMIASIAVAAPERIKMRASWLLGTAFELVAQEDSLFAWVPSRRAGVTLGGASGELGVREPVALACRALGGTWEPPAAAWHVARADSAGRTLTWLESGDTLELRVGGDALPRQVRLGRKGGEVRVRYTSWQTWRDAPWPQRIEITDGTGWARLRIEMEQPHAAKQADPRWFALRVPADARILGWEELRSLLGLSGPGE